MPDRRTLLLVQLPIPPLGFETVADNVPLAAGCLAAATGECAAACGLQIDILPPEIMTRFGDRALVEFIAARRPTFVGFTCYLWNVERSLWIARRLKERLPQLAIILGGPEVQTAHPWLWRESGFDAAVCGEGEAVMRHWVQVCHDRRAWSAVAGLFVAPEFAAPRPAAPWKLETAQSPYTAGILVPQGTMWLETARGCRFRCKYCCYHQGAATLRFFAPEEVRKNLRLAVRNAVREVFLLDPTLNQRRDFSEFIDLLFAENRQRRLRFSAEMRAENIDEPLARRLRQAGFDEVEIGLQTIEPAARRAINRTGSIEAFFRGARALREQGIRTRVDLIMGLPGDTIESLRAAVDALIVNEAFDELQLFPLALLPGAPLTTEADRWGLQAQQRPPYYVIATPTLDWVSTAQFVEETQRRLGIEYDPAPLPPQLPYRRWPATEVRNGQSSGSAPPPWLSAEISADLCWLSRQIDLDRLPPDDSWQQVWEKPPWPALSAALHLRSRRFAAVVDRAKQIVARAIADDPFITWTFVLEPVGDPRVISGDLLERLFKECRRVITYTDRLLSVQLDRRRGSRRLVIVVPKQYSWHAIQSWRRRAERWAQLVRPEDLTPAFP